ncbi:hypothetical protein J6590_016164 [Homalodisca vitripennis]|nr:hypothetical protein J6590_016164 [Homalodisca vitripennis]
MKTSRKLFHKKKKQYDPVNKPDNKTIAIWDVINGERKDFHTIIVELVEYILDNFEEDYITTSIFIDLSKAFDCPSHDHILAKLESLGKLQRGFQGMEPNDSYKFICTRIHSLNHLQRNGHQHIYNTRYAENFSFPTHTKKPYLRRNLAGAKFFSRLPEDIKSNNPEVLKHRQLNWLLYHSTPSIIEMARPDQKRHKKTGKKRQWIERSGGSVLARQSTTWGTKSPRQ